MRKAMTKIVWLCLVAVAATLQPGCSGTLFFRPARPAMIVEARSAPPQQNARWVNGDYRWDSRQKNWVWAPGHWKNGHQKHNNGNGHGNR